MKCEICNRSPATEPITLHRMNEKGINGIWRCEGCLSDEQLSKIDPEIRKLTDIINPPNKRV